MPRNERHVVPNPDGGWNIQKPGSGRRSGHEPTQREAIEVRGRFLAVLPSAKEASINKLRVWAPSRGARSHPAPCEYNRYSLRDRAPPSIHDPAPKPCNLFSDAS